MNRHSGKPRLDASFQSRSVSFEIAFDVLCVLGWEPSQVNAVFQLISSLSRFPCSFRSSRRSPPLLPSSCSPPSVSPSFSPFLPQFFLSPFCSPLPRSVSPFSFLSSLCDVHSRCFGSRINRAVCTWNLHSISGSPRCLTVTSVLGVT